MQVFILVAGWVAQPVESRITRNSVMVVFIFFPLREPNSVGVQVQAGGRAIVGRFSICAEPFVHNNVIFNSENDGGTVARLLR